VEIQCDQAPASIPQPPRKSHNLLDRESVGRLRLVAVLNAKVAGSRLGDFDPLRDGPEVREVVESDSLAEQARHPARFPVWRQRVRHTHVFHGRFVASKWPVD
jgi:hypothetical protein